MSIALTPNDMNTMIENIIRDNAVVLFMKGEPKIPMCGFSGFVVQVLQKLSVPFFGVNVLSDPELRQGIKDFTRWPTIPQLYIHGEFIGGADIVKEMFENGDLLALLTEKKLVSEMPTAS